MMISPITYILIGMLFILLAPIWFSAKYRLFALMHIGMAFAMLGYAFR